MGAAVLLGVFALDRTIVYPGALPLDTDILTPQRNTMVALGYLMNAVMGYKTVGSFSGWADGLTCTSAGGSTMGVVIGAGCLASLVTVDGTAYGSLTTDTSALVKLGLNKTTTALALTNSTTAGQSQNFLICGTFSETDTTAIALPYYNAASPSTPYTGPANSGTTQNTVRAQTVTLSVVSGTAATTGTQTTQPVTAGYAPLWVVTVTNGDVTPNAGRIYMAANAPFVGTKLTATRQKLAGATTFYVSGNGVDSNNGLSTNTAFLTIQACVNYVANNYDFNGQTVTISLGAATFATATVTGLLTGQTTALSFSGAGSGSTTVAGLSVQSGAAISVQNMTLTGTNSLYCAAGCNITVGAGNVLSGTGFKLYANGGVITLAASYTDTGSAQNHFYAINGGIISIFTNITVTLTGTPAYSVAFCSVVGGQYSPFGGVITFAGTGATGIRYTSTGGGYINTSGAGVNYFPGSAAGSTGSGTNIGFYS